jgi:DNA polymerase-3 subunit delta
MKIVPYQIESYIQKIAGEKIAGCLVFGPESSLVSHRFNIIAKKISPDLSDPFLVSNISKERISEDKALLVDEFFSMSMLGGRRLILIKDCDAKAGEALKALCEDKDFAKKSENFILIQGGDLDKSSSLRKICEDNPYFATIACYEDNEGVIRKFIADELVKRKIRFTAPVTEILLGKFGSNRLLILSEIEKIVNFLGEEKNLTPEIAESLSESEAEASINSFISSFAAQKFDVALVEAEKNFRDGVDAITLVRFLSNYIQKLYQARVEIDTKVSDFETAIKNQRLFFKTEIEFRKNLTSLSLKFLKKILCDLEKLEMKIKSGEPSPKLLFTAFVQDLLAKK